MKKAKSILEGMLKGEEVSRWTISSHISELRELLTQNKYKALEEDVEYLLDCCHY